MSRLITSYAKPAILITTAFLLFGCDTASNTQANDKSYLTQWEPIGKYSNDEIKTVSNFMAEVQKRAAAFDATHKDFSASLDQGLQTKDGDVLANAIATLDANTQRVVNDVYTLEIPDIKNKQAKMLLADVVMQLGEIAQEQSNEAQEYSALVKEPRNAEAHYAVAHIYAQEKTQAEARYVLRVGRVYASYGYTLSQMDSHTFQLKSDAKPDRAADDNTKPFEM